MSKRNKAREIWLDKYRAALVQACGAAAILGFTDHAATLCEMIDAARVDKGNGKCYNTNNQRRKAQKTEGKKMATIIRKGDEFTDESGDLRIIRIEGKHFSDYAVSVWKCSQDEDSDDLIHDHDTIMTAAEIRKLANARNICFEDEEDEDEEAE